MPQPHITSNTDPKPRPVTHHGAGAVSYAGSSPGVAYPQQQQQGNNQFGHAQQQQQQMPVSSGNVSTGGPAAQVAQPQPRRPPSGIVNPMFATADFSMPQHPYQNVYVAPNYSGNHSSSLYY